MTHLSLLFCFLQRTVSVDHELTILVQPQIVGIGEEFDLDNSYTVLCTIPHHSIVALLSSFYTFNMMVYEDSKAILSFLEQALMTNLTKLNILCDSDNRNGNELIVCSKYGSQRPLLATAALKLYYNNQFLLDSRRQNIYGVTK